MCQDFWEELSRVLAICFDDRLFLSHDAARLGERRQSKWWTLIFVKYSFAMIILFLWCIVYTAIDSSGNCHWMWSAVQYVCQWISPYHCIVLPWPQFDLIHSPHSPGSALKTIPQKVCCFLTNLLKKLTHLSIFYKELLETTSRSTNFFLRRAKREMY